MSERKLMHVREIMQAARAASLQADQYQIARAPIYRPRRWLADKLAEAYHRGAADMARRVLTGHNSASGPGPAEGPGYAGRTGSQSESKED